MASPTSAVRFAMKPSALAALALGILGAVRGSAADATRPVDYTQRNGSFAPAAGTAVTPEKQAPVTNSRVQDKRVDQPLLEKTPAPQGERRAGIDVQETRDKRVHDKDSQRPAGQEQPTSAFNQRRAAIATSTDTTKPPTVAKYQDSLTAASASNMARFPALKRATTAKINRFVFRRNPPETASAAEGKPVTPAGGPAGVATGANGPSASR